MSVATTFDGNPEVDDWGEVIAPKLPDESPPQLRSVEDVPLVRSVASDPITFAVQGVIAVGAVTLFTGDSGAGKTTLVSAFADAVARGILFAGRQTLRMPVLYLDRENPISIVVERFDRLGISDSGTFRVWGGWLPVEAPEPASPIILDWVRASSPKPMVIIDSVVAFHRGAENDATEIRKTFAQYRMLANLGCTVVPLHHSGKSDTSKDFRGSSDVKAAVDVAYHVSNSGDSGRLDLLKLRAFKQRFAVDPEVLLRYRDGEFLPGHSGTLRTVLDQLTDLLRANPGIKIAAFQALATGNGIARDRARDFINEGIERGRIRGESAGRNATALYLNQG